MVLVVHAAVVNYDAANYQEQFDFAPLECQCSELKEQNLIDARPGKTTR